MTAAAEESLGRKKLPAVDLEGMIKREGDREVPAAPAIDGVERESCCVCEGVDSEECECMN